MVMTLDNENRIGVEKLSAGLRAEEARIRELLRDIEIPDLGPEGVMQRLREIEKGLKRLRQAG